MMSSRLNRGFGRVFALVLNVLVISSLLLGSFSNVLAQDEVPPLVTQEPVVVLTAQTAEPTAEPIVEPTAEPAAEPIAEPTAQTAEPEVEILSAGEVTIQEAPLNDNMANATVIAALSYSTTQSTTEATLEAGEPVNVCNQNDTGSVWYRFTAPTTGVYNINVYGSGYSPNLSVLEDTGSIPVVCGETHTDWGSSEYAQLAFNTTAGTTYLVGVSDAEGGGALTFSLEELACPTDALCGAAVGGDGRVIHDPDMTIYSTNWNGYYGRSRGDFNGFVQSDSFDGDPGIYNIRSDGNDTLIKNEGVAIPGYYTPSAVGYPKVTVSMLGIDGNPLEDSHFSIVSSAESSFGAFFYDPFPIYLPVGIYNITALSEGAGLEIYQPEINIVSSSVPGTVTLDPRLLARDTFTFNMDGITESNVVISVYNYSLGINIDSGRTVTFAAPVGTEIHGINFQFYDTDTSGQEWTYFVDLLDAPITVAGGTLHTLSAGGTISLHPTAIDAPYVLSGGEAEISAGVEDAYGNTISQINFDLDTTAGEISELVNNDQAFDEFQTPEGEILERVIPESENVTIQELIWTSVPPTYIITDGAGDPVATDPVSWIGDELTFTLSPVYTAGTWTVTEELDLGPHGGHISGSTNFEVSALPPMTNDNIAGAKTAALNTTYTQSTFGATLEAGEPQNVCNVNDTGSVWYKFTAPSTGIYNINTWGSNYASNISVLRRVDASTRTPVVCGETRDWGWEGYTQLAFNATAGYTYLIGVSDDLGGSLRLKLSRLSCPTGHLCGTAVGGDGRVVHDPYIRILDSAGSYKGGGNGDFNGFIDGSLSSGGSGTYQLVIIDSNNIIVKPSVAIPGIFSASAVGLPKTTIDVKDTEGESVAVNSIAVVSTTNRNIGSFMGGTEVDAPLELYAPAGTYNLFAASSEAGLEVYQPGVSIVSSSNPGTVTLDASSPSLARDTFTYDLDGITHSYTWIYSPDGYGHYMRIDGDRTITFAAPLGAVLPWVHYEFNETDPDGLDWSYYMDLGSNVSILGGVDHLYQVGGEISISLSAEEPRYRLDENSGGINALVEDAFGNQISSIGYYGYVESGALGGAIVDRAELIESLTTVVKEDGETYQRSLIDTPEMTAQDSTWVSVRVFPSYTVTDGVGTPVETDPVTYLSNTLNFYIPPASAIGTWNAHATLDLGPYQLLDAEGSTTFEVYSAAQHPLTNDNDLYLNAADLSMPSLGPVDTMGATTSTSDPALGSCMYWRYSLADKGLASVWYKYVPAQDGLLSVDTFGSDYDTVLAVYRGTPSTTTRVACSDDTYDPWDMDSALSVAVAKDTTYYIEVVDSGFGVWKTEVGAQSLEMPAQDEVNAEQIGGSLTLNASLTPCYSLTVTADPATGGTVTRSPAPNCLSTKYVEGTDVTLTAAPKTNYDMWKWSQSDGADITFSNPYTLPVISNLSLKALFVAVPGKPALSSPASNALVFAHELNTLKWYASSPVAATYEVQVAYDAAFTSIVNTWTTDLTYQDLAADTLSADTSYFWRVRGISKMGQLGPWSLVRALRAAVTQTNGLAIYDDNLDITEYDPENPGTEWLLHTNRPQFRWDAVDGASGYTIQISRYGNFSSLVTSGTVSGIDNTFFTPAVNLPANTDLYWRVCANSASRGPGDWGWSTEFQVPLAPPIPALVFPASNALTVDYQPAFDWSNVVVPAVQPALASYEFQVAADPGFYNLWFGMTVTTSDIDLGELDFPPTMDFNADYYWRVRAYDAAGNFSPWSAGRKLRTAVTPPALSTPANGELTHSNRPTFTWNTVSGASGYTIQIARNESFSLLLSTGTLTGMENTSFTPTVNLPVTDASHPLWWRVRANSPTNGPGNWSEMLWFTVPPSPPIPVLLTPANGALITGYTPTLSWKNGTSLSSAPATDHYEIQLATDKYFEETSEFPPVVGTSFVPPENLDDNELYYWRVRACDATTPSICSGWSTARSFKTRVDRPSFIDVTNGPGDWTPYVSGTLYTNRPMFRWMEVAGASGYTMQVSNNPGFTTLFHTGTVTGGAKINYIPTVNLPANTDLYWRVRANSPTNGPGEWMPAPGEAQFSFEVPVAPTGVPALTSPASNTLSLDTTPLLDWSDVTGAIAYYYEISPDPSFFNTFETGYRPASEVEVVNTLASNTTYYWRVRACGPMDPVTICGGWSAVRSIRIAVGTPSDLEIHNVLPSGGALSLRPTFAWDPVTGATGYTLQISRNAGFTSLVGTYTRPAADDEYTPTVNLPANVTLFWRIRADSSTHGPGAWATSTVIMPNPPSTPTLVSPANGAQLTDTSPLLDWSNATVPAGTAFAIYLVELSTSPAFDSGLIMLIVTGSPALSYFEAPLLDLDETYYWRVRSENTAGAYSAWSEVRSFRVIGP